MSVDKSAPIMVLESDDTWMEEEVKKKVWTGPLDQAIKMVDALYNWGRRSSIWPMQFGLACCAIEMIASGGGRFDIARFGSELFRPSPRQADLMIVAGTVTKKMVPAIVRLYNQMAEPKYVLAMGACASAGGPFKEGYNVVSGIDKFLPVDVYVPGCPPTPQALLMGLIMLQRKIDGQTVRNVPWYQAEAHEAVPEPILGPDIFDPRRAVEIKQVSSNEKEMEARYIRLAARAELKHGKKEGEEGEAKPTPKPAARPAAAAGATAAKPTAAAPRTAPAAAAPKPTETEKAAAGSGATGKQDPAPVAAPMPPRSEAEQKLEENKADANFAQQAEAHHAQTAQAETPKVETLKTENTSNEPSNDGDKST